MEKVFLALGSNIGDKEKNIKKAISLLSEKIDKIRAGGIYISKAAGYENQPNFYNTVISGFTELSPEELFYFAKDIEDKVGRVYRFHWGPREIDIDILFYGKKIIKKDFLEIPHPRLHERDFVLRPLLDLEADFIHPIFKKTILELFKDIKNKSIISRL